MFTGILIGALSAAALIQQTDTLVQADGANRIHMQVLRGEVVVRTWDQDAVHVKADHAPDREVQIRRSGRTLVIGLDDRRGTGPEGRVDFELVVPRGFDLDLEGMNLRVDIQDTDGNIEVTTVQGPIQVQGGRGSIALESMSGRITVEGARGHIRANAVAGAITVSGSSGDISVEAVSGSITLSDIVSRQVEARTVSGSLRYEGSIEDGGRYTFGTHAGNVRLHLPEDMNARVSAVTLTGNIQVDFPGAPDTTTPGRALPGLPEKRLTFETGDASARVSVETFAGNLYILRR